MKIATQRLTKSAIEVRSIDHIPLDERHGRVRDQFTFWFANNANIFPVVLGGVTIFLGLTFVWACVAIVLGVLIGQALVGFHAIQGPRLGLPQMLQSRAQFGFYGVILVFAASIVLDFGFFAAQLVIQADAMNLLLPGISVPVWIALLAVPVLILTIYGYDVIHRWQRWMTWLLAATFLVMIAQAFASDGLEGSVAGSATPTIAAFLGATGLFVIAMASWAPYVSDYSRYLPPAVSSARTFWAVVLGSAIPAIFCGILGAYLTGLMPEAPSTVAAVASLSGTWVLPIMAISLVGSDVANCYTGMLALVGIASSFRNVSRSVLVRVVGSVVLVLTGTLCALFGYQQFVANLGNFLNVLLLVFIPWSAINLTDFYLVRHGQYDIPSFFTPRGMYGGFAWRGLSAYLIAVALEVPFIDQTFYTGPLVEPLGGVDISWIVGGLAGLLCYLALALVRPARTSEPALTVAADRSVL